MGSNIVLLTNVWWMAAPSLLSNKYKMYFAILLKNLPNTGIAGKYLNFDSVDISCLQSPYSYDVDYWGLVL